jgi:hypothetical protein
MSAYIFMDESGDLGFGKRSSKWFIFTIAIVKDKRSLERVVRKIWKPLKKSHQQLGELHAYHATAVTKTRMLQKLSELEDLKVLCIVLNKQKVYVDLQNQKNYLYNYTANILLDRLHKKGVIDGEHDIELFIDRKDTKKSLRENFINYLDSAMSERKAGKLSISLHSSNENKSIQAVDFISWAIFRKYERGDFEYYELIKNKIEDERLLFA